MKHHLDDTDDYDFHLGSPAPELFQARLNNALAGLKGVACIADDILIAGSGDTKADATADHNY